MNRDEAEALYANKYIIESPLNDIDVLVYSLSLDYDLPVANIERILRFHDFDVVEDVTNTFDTEAINKLEDFINHKDT